MVVEIQQSLWQAVCGYVC